MNTSIMLYLPIGRFNMYLQNNMCSSIYNSNLPESGQIKLSGDKSCMRMISWTKDLLLSLSPAAAVPPHV